MVSAALMAICGSLFAQFNFFSEREKGVAPVLHGLGGEGKSALALAYAIMFIVLYMALLIVTD